MNKIEEAGIKSKYQEIKDHIKISYFKNNYTYGGLIDFDDFGDRLFISNPKKVECTYVLNDLDGKNRALKEYAKFPFIVYIDIDFHTDNQLNTFKEDLKITKDELFKKLEQDNNIWILGNSKSGEGIRMFFVVYNKQAHESGNINYHDIHIENSNVILNYLEEKYGLIYHNDIQKDYIDRAPIRNMVLKTYSCLLNNNSKVNNQCNIIIYNGDSEETNIIQYNPSKNIIKKFDKFDKNITTLSYDDIDYIDDSQFSHYNPRLLANAKFADQDSRLLFYNKFFKNYEGSGLKNNLESFEKFNEYLNKSTFKYTLDDAKNTINYLINNPYDPDDDDEDYDDDVIETPIIPDEVYSKMPNLLQEMISHIKDNRERDIFITSELSIISSLLNNVTITYWGDTLHLNFNSFCVASAGGSKGILKQCKNTLKVYRDKLKEEHEREYDKWLNNGEKKDKNDKGPQRKYFIIPGNISSAAFFKIFDLQQGKGCLIETEASTIQTAFKQEWGDYKNIILSSFNNEDINHFRMDTQILIENPQLATILTGTHKVLFTIIPSCEDGFFSRFLYYLYNEKTEYKNPIIDRPNIENVFSNYFAQKIYELSEYYYNYNPEIIFSKNISEKLTNFWKVNQKKYKMINEEDMDSIVKRYSVVQYRLLAIFTCIRAWENHTLFSNKNNKIEALEEDADVVVELMKVYLKHVELIFYNLDKKDIKILRKNPSDDLIKFILNQEDDFKRALIITKAKEFKLTDRTVSRILKKLVEEQKLYKNSCYYKVINKNETHN